MPDLSDLKSGQIISARMEGPSVTKTAQIFGVLRGTVWKIWLHLQKKKKRKYPVHCKAQGWPKDEVVWERPSDFTSIVRKDRTTTTLKITFESNEHLQNPVSTKTVHWKLHKGTFHERVAIRKPLFSQTNVSNHLQCCMAHRNWSLVHWKKVIFFDKLLSFLFPTTGRVYV